MRAKNKYIRLKSISNSINGFRFILLTILFFLSVIKVDAQEPLMKYQEVAAENNPGLKAAFNEYMAAMEEVPQVGALPDPKVAFEYFVAPIETRMGPQQFKAGLSQKFPWFGTLEAKENAATQSAKAKYEIFKQKKSLLMKEVRDAYFDLYFNQEAIDITRGNLDILDTFDELVLIKIKAGKTSTLDNYRLEMEQGDLENRLAFLRDQQVTLAAIFNNLLNREMTTPVDIPDTLWNTELSLNRQAISDSITEQNHQLLSLDFQSEALNYQEEIAEKAGKPSFSVGLGYAVIGQGDMNLQGKDAFVFPKIGMTIPLYRNKYKAKVKEVIHLKTARYLQREETDNRLQSQFSMGWRDYEDAKRRVTLFREQENLANQSLEILKTQYANNKVAFEEILRMERKLLKYKLELEKARTDQQSAISFIHYLMGK